MASMEPNDSGRNIAPYGTWYGDGQPEAPAEPPSQDISSQGPPVHADSLPRAAEPLHPATAPLPPAFLAEHLAPAEPLPYDSPSKEPRSKKPPVGSSPQPIADTSTASRENGLRLAPAAPKQPTGYDYSGAPFVGPTMTDVAVEEPSLFQLYVGFAPAWLSSFIVHLLLVIVLAALMLALPTSTPPVTIRLSDFDDTEELVEGQELEIPEQVPEEPVEMPDPDPAEFADFNIPPADTEIATEHEPKVEVPSDVGPPQPQGLQSIERAEGASPRNLLAGRAKGMKKFLLVEHGGTAKTEAAVTAGLEWLARRQRGNGEWKLDGPYANASDIKNSNAATAMALLAFQGAGYTHKTGENKRFRPVVRRGWYWLLRRQGRLGSFAEKTADDHHYYTHALCTFALCEIYAMTGDRTYRQRAQLAVNYLVENQDKRGGWRYRRGGSDLSVSGWVMMALQSARMGGLKVSQDTLDRYSLFLDDVAKDYGARYSYTVRSGQPSMPMTAEGLLCRQYLGWKRDHGALLNGSGYLLKNPINYERSQNVYYWYYATQVLHHMGGKMWKEWNRTLSEKVPEQQVKKGRERGSWSPRKDRHGGEGGRLYTTCLSIYMLEVYYRHLPIYSQDIRREERRESNNAGDSIAGSEEETLLLD